MLPTITHNFLLKVLIANSLPGSQFSNILKHQKIFFCHQFFSTLYAHVIFIKKQNHNIVWGPKLVSPPSLLCTHTPNPQIYPQSKIQCPGLIFWATILSPMLSSTSKFGWGCTFCVCSYPTQKKTLESKVCQ